MGDFQELKLMSYRTRYSVMSLFCRSGCGGFVQSLARRRTHRLGLSEHFTGGHQGTRPVLAAQEARHGGATK